MNNVFASKTNRAFFQTVFASLFALVSVFFLSLKIYEASLSYFGIIMHKIKDYCNCTSMTQFLSMHPVIFGTIIIFGIMILGLIIYSLRKLAKLVLQTKGYADYYLLFAEANHSPKLKLVMEDLGIDENKVIEINKPEIVVFCFGILDPRICISQFLVNSLDKDELKAVLAHENQHMASYEPLKLFIVKYLRDVFFFLPAIGSYAKKYITFSELAADEKASGSAEERSSLASAILKISQQEEKRRLDNHLTLSYFSPAIVERANRLSDEAYVPRFKYLDKNFIKGSLALAVVSLVAFVALSDSTKAFEMHGIGNCVSNFKPSSWLEVPEMNNNANEGKSSSAPLSPEASEGHSEVSEGKQDAGSLYNPASNQSFCNIAGYNDPRNPVCNDN